MGFLSKYFDSMDMPLETILSLSTLTIFTFSRKWDLQYVAPKIAISLTCVIVVVILSIIIFKKKEHRVGQ